MIWEGLNSSAILRLVILGVSEKEIKMAFWRDLSVVWLSLFCFVGMAIPLVILYFAVRGMNALHDKSYHLLRRLQTVSSKVPRQAERIATQVSEPVVQVQKRVKRVESFLHALLNELRSYGR